jgi:hypothetical protein
MEYWEIYLNDDSVPVVGKTEMPLVSNQIRPLGAPFVVSYITLEDLDPVSQRIAIVQQIRGTARAQSETIVANAYRLGERDLGM